VSDLIARFAARAVDAPVAAPTGPRRATPAAPVLGEDATPVPPPHPADGGTRDAASTRRRPALDRAAPAGHVDTVVAASGPPPSPAWSEPEPASGPRPEDAARPLASGRTDRAASGPADRSDGAAVRRTPTAPAVRGTATSSGETTAGSEPPGPPADVDAQPPSVALATATRPARPPPAVGGSDGIAPGHRGGGTPVADVPPVDAPEPVVRVHIGRLDVRPVIAGRDRGRGPVTTPDPGLSLGAYLRGQRDAP
jgi:translation initiation factor IF-2